MGADGDMGPQALPEWASRGEAAAQVARQGHREVQASGEEAGASMSDARVPRPSEYDWFCIVSGMRAWLQRVKETRDRVDEEEALASLANDAYAMWSALLLLSGAGGSAPSSGALAPRSEHNDPLASGEVREYSAPFVRSGRLPPSVPSSARGAGTPGNVPECNHAAQRLFPTNGGETIAWCSPCGSVRPMAEAPWQSPMLGPRPLAVVEERKRLVNNLARLREHVRERCKSCGRVVNVGELRAGRTADGEMVCAECQLCSVCDSPMHRRSFQGNGGIQVLWFCPQCCKPTEPKAVQS